MSNRYFFKFRKTDTGLTPTFLFYKNALTLDDVTPPTVTELAGGVYYFDPTATDPEIVFQIDGGASIPSDQRYISATITPKEADALSRILGLMHENSLMDNTNYTNGKLASARVRLYDTAANATLAGADGVLYSYNIFAEYTGGGNLSKYKVVRTL